MPYETNSWYEHQNYYMTHYIFFHQNITVGVNKNWTLVFVNFSAQDASILKISVPINKRRSWRFRNTPRNQLFDEYWPRKQPKQSGTKTACLNQSIKPIFGDLPFSLNCHNLAQNNLNFASWGCFGILRTSSWWWAQRFLKLMHPGLRN